MYKGVPKYISECKLPHPTTRHPFWDYENMIGNFDKFTHVLCVKSLIL